MAALALAAALTVADSSLAQPSQETVRKRAAEIFGAQVLRMAEGTIDGRTVWLVTLMHPGGNDNAAFKVDTVAIDAQTGEPIRGRYPQSPGATDLGSARTQMIERRPEVLRGRAWR